MSHHSPWERVCRRRDVGLGFEELHKAGSGMAVLFIEAHPHTRGASEGQPLMSGSGETLSGFLCLK